MKSKWQVIGILWLAFVLRLIALNARPLWYDDVFSVFLAEKNLPTIAAGTAADTMPPLYYFLLHYWMRVVGETPFALRMLSVAISMSVVALVYTIAARAVSTAAGRWAALFTALAPFEIYHAQELRMYGALALALMLYLYAVIRLSTAERGTSVLIAISTALALYSHNLAFLTLLAADVYFVCRRAWGALGRLIVAQVVGALLFLPWLVYVPGQLAKIQQAFWTQPPGIADVLQMLVEFTTYLPLPNLVFAGALFVSLAVVVIASLELVRFFRRGAPPALGLLLVFALVPPALMFGVSYLMRPVFVPRGVIASELAYYILLAALVVRAPRAARIGVALVVGIIALTTLPFFYSAWGEWRRAPFAEADQFLRAQVQPGDLILHDNKLSYFPMRYYDRALPQQFVADPPGTANDTFAPGSQEAMGIFPVELNAAIQGRTRVWFVIFQTSIDETAAAGHPQGNVAQLDAAMRPVNSASFGDLRIIHYETR